MKKEIISLSIIVEYTLTISNSLIITRFHKVLEKHVI
jgi:hypothetical protein